jgi:hypothetical protein
MGIPVGMHYTSRVSGAAAKPGSCEECGLEYIYLLEREAEGHGSSVLFLDNAGGQRRAAEAAEKALAKRLDRECEVVPCPKCGHIQRDMVRLAKRQHLRLVKRIGWIWTGLAAVFGILNAASSIGMEGPYFLPWPAFAAIAAVGPAMLAIRLLLAQAYDPNTIGLDDRMAAAKRLALTREEFEKRMKEAEERQPKRGGGHRGT